MRALHLVFCALIAGCSSGAPPPSSETRAPSVVEAPPATIAEAPSIPRADVDGLLARWLDAQNAGDFDAYAALYADRFGGVRRTERASFRLDHDGWLDDRRRLFAQPMHVAMDDVEVFATPTSAIVHFAQRWQAGAYADEGPKRMVLVRVGDALRISSEEMLDVHTVAPGTAAIADVLPAFDTESGTLLVLGEARGAGEGVARELITRSMHLALRDVDATLPQAFAHLAGAHVQLVGSRGVCSSTIESLARAAMVSPDEATYGAWHGGDFGDGVRHAPMPTEQIAIQVFAMAEHRYWVALVGASSCGPARAAVIGDRAPVVWERLDRPETRAAVIDRLFSSDERAHWIDSARRIDRERADVSDDRIADRLRNTAVVREYARPGHASVIQATVLLSEQCGGYEERFFFRRTGETITAIEVPGFQDIDGVIDVDDDDTPELITTEGSGVGGRTMRLGARATTLGEWLPSAFGCRC